MTRGCSSPAWPIDPVAEHAARRTGPGATARRSAGAHGRARRARPGRRRGPPRRRRPRSPAGPGPTSPSASTLAAQHDRDVPRLVGQRGVQRGQLGVGRPALDARAAAGLVARAAGQEDQTGLEQREVAVAAADVARAGRQQPGQQRRAQLRLVVRERVGQPQRVAAAGRRRRGRSGRATAGDDERVARAPRRSRPRRAPATPPGAAAAGRSARDPAGCRRQHGRELVVAGQPDDLLDEVGGDDQVRPPASAARTAGRHRRRRPCSRRPRDGRRRPSRGDRHAGDRARAASHGSVDRDGGAGVPTTV